MQAAIMSSSSSSMRATGMPSCITAMTVSTAAASVGNWQTAALVASGMPCRRSRTLVTTPSVPSLPTISRVRS
jgi:hypothetical protein